jgi:hypothetical protein
MQKLKSHREIAEILGIGRARVFYLEHQALRMIREMLAEMGIDGMDRLLEAPAICELSRDGKIRTGNLTFHCLSA